MIAAGGIYVLGGMVLYLMQERILFHPVSRPMDYQFNFEQPFTELNLAEGKNNLCLIKFRTPGARRGMVLFFHGNVGSVEHYKKYPSLFLRNGYEAWMMDYPGFGKSTGKRTEAVLYDEALMLYDLALKEIHGDSIVIYGKSLGTGIASYVAAHKNCRRLILETPYYSIGALAKHYFPFYPVRSMIRYSLPNYEYLKKIKAPVSIFHGTEDEVVPYYQGKKLAEENAGIELITIEKGKHNNLYDFALFQQKLDSLLSAQAK
jgi:alpha-beta hydrolase superfamily lysophospholipase